MDVSLFELTEAYSILPAAYGVFVTLSFWSCDSGTYGDSLQCTGSTCLIILTHESYRIDENDVFGRHCLLCHRGDYRSIRPAIVVSTAILLLLSFFPFM